MKCERCKKNEATFFYKESINGEKKSYALCGDCARELQESGELSAGTSPFEELGLMSPFASFGDTLLGSLFYPPEAGKLGSSVKQCPVCGFTLRDFKERGRAGCPSCYSAFSEELEPTVRSIHGSSVHTGRAPRGLKEKRARASKIKELRRGLSEAVRKEEFEAAARLRDEIRALEEKGDN